MSSAAWNALHATLILTVGLKAALRQAVELSRQLAWAVARQAGAACCGAGQNQPQVDPTVGQLFWLWCSPRLEGHLYQHHHHQYTSVQEGIGFPLGTQSVCNQLSPGWPVTASFFFPIIVFPFLAGLYRR